MLNDVPCGVRPSETFMVANSLARMVPQVAYAVRSEDGQHGPWPGPDVKELEKMMIMGRDTVEVSLKMSAPMSPDSRHLTLKISHTMSVSVWEGGRFIGSWPHLHRVSYEEAMDVFLPDWRAAEIMES